MTLLRNTMGRVRNRNAERTLATSIEVVAAEVATITRTRTRTIQRPLQPVSICDPTKDAGLVAALTAYDSRPEDDRLDSQANNQLIHVSSLPDLCPRAVALAAQHGNLTTLLKRVTSNDRIVWDMGRATEHLVRDRIIESLGVDRILGRWVCPCDSDEHYYEEEDDYRLPVGHHYLPCGCGRKQISVYQEMQLLDAEYGIIGNCDLPYFDDDGRVVVTEIKSAKGEFFKDIVTDDPWNQPTAMLRTMFSSHSYQASAYNRLFEKQGYEVAPYIRILYVSKNYLREVPYKEVIVPMDRMNARLDAEWNKARIIKEALDTGTLPSKLNACDTHTTTTAKNCPLLTACFSRG